MSARNYLQAVIFSITIFSVENKSADYLQAQSNCFIGAQPAEEALWEEVEKRIACSASARTWFQYAYQIGSGAWQNYGYNNQCNIELPYAKLFNSAYLLLHGLNDDPSKWHPTADYRNLAEGAATDLSHNAHYIFSYAPANVHSGWNARSIFGSSVVEVSCLLFDEDSYSNDPAIRAGVCIHEGLHHSKYKSGYKTDHENTGCFAGANACDYFWPHAKGDSYIHNQTHIWEWKYHPQSGNVLFHSPNQAQIEFLTDLVVYPAEFVPKIVRESAYSNAENRIENRIIGTVPYWVHVPKP